MISGEKIASTGWYGYDGHVESGIFDCFIPQQSNRMLLKKGEVTPMLGSCEHAIKWKLIELYSK